MPGKGYLDALAPRLRAESPSNMALRKSAAVAVIILKSAGKEEVLLIRRAQRDGDPWSGQVAFPGGMVDAADESFEATARRETLEEVGIDLSRGACFRGYMGQIRATLREVVVVPAVFELGSPVDTTPSSEVAACFWVPIAGLAGRDARATFHQSTGKTKASFPSLIYGDAVIWGMTERILSEIIGDVQGGASASP